MKTEDYHHFAKTGAILGACYQANLIHPQIAYHAGQNYKSALKKYKFDTNELGKHEQYYWQQFIKTGTVHDCQALSRDVEQQLIARAEAEAKAEAIIQSLNSLSNSITNSMNQTTQMYQNMNNNYSKTPTQIQPFQPIYNIRPPKTTCIKLSHDMVSCK